MKPSVIAAMFCLAITGSLGAQQPSPLRLNEPYSCPGNTQPSANGFVGLVNSWRGLAPCQLSASLPHTVSSSFVHRRFAHGPPHQVCVMHLRCAATRFCTHEARIARPPEPLFLQGWPSDKRLLVHALLRLLLLRKPAGGQYFCSFLEWRLCIESSNRCAGIGEMPCS
jgi:hypothetical protein